jgi:hypothetical protein
MRNLLVLPALLSCTLAAQSFYIPSNTPGTGTCNVIPFGNTNTSATWVNQIYQTIATAADLGNTAGLITGIAFAPCGSGNHINTSLRVSLSHVPANHVLQATFAANQPSPVVVLDLTDHVWPLTANQWNEIGLQTAFAYDGSSDLCIEIIAQGNHLVGTSGFHRDVRPRAFATTWVGTPPATGSVDSAALKWRVSMTVADVSLYGEGCGGLTHSYTGIPQLGATQLDANISGCAPNSPAFLILGTNNGAPFPIDLSFLGMTGCRLYHDMAIVVPTGADGSGNATVRLGPVPNLRSWLGAKVYTQGANLNTSAPGSVTTSNYARLLFGT